MSETKICPECGQAEQVEKVSTIYLLGMGLKREQGQAMRPWLSEMPQVELKALGKRLSPPSAGRGSPVRPLHPDLVVATFSLVIPIFLAGIWNTQPGMRLPAVLVLAAFYGLYLWKRKAILKRFERQKAEQKAAAQRIQSGIARWMKLYYCAEDDVVFAPGGEAIPADQMPGYLLENQT